MADGRFISYLRVSTAKQGASGLGLEAQRKTVTDFLNGGNWTLLSEVVEIESGKRSDRPKLQEALRLCRLHRATLVVAKVDRLARSQAFLSKILASGVDVRFCDLPVIEGPTGRFILQQMASVAELEAGLIGARTKAALAAAKARGVALGGDRGGRAPEGALAKGRQVRAANVAGRVADLAPVVAEIRATGASSLRQIAAALNERQISTAKGGEWGAVQVSRLLQALEGKAA